MNRKTKRILNELKELQESVEIFKESGIHYYFNDENIEKVYIMLLGPEDTPYEKGFYFFTLEYPENYPMVPPNMKFCTNGSLFNYLQKPIKIRFNPNLYTSGKVCLSMLNTWKGPGWVPTNTVSNILVAIQALVFNQEPLRNEPGFENSDSKEINLYNEVISFSNIKISVCDQLNTTNLGDFEYFRPQMIEYVKKYKSYYEKIKKETEDKEIHSVAYGMHVILDFCNLNTYYDSVITKLKI